MAKGARNKQRKKARRIRREIFEPRLIAQQDAITPDLDKLRENIDAKNATIAETIEKQQEEAKNASTAENDTMSDNKTNTKSTVGKFDSQTLKNEDGNYATWLTGKEVKKLKKINNKKKTQTKNKKKQIEKRLKALANTEGGRKAIELMKQKKLDEKTEAKKSEMETC